VTAALALAGERVAQRQSVAGACARRTQRLAPKRFTGPICCAMHEPGPPSARTSPRGKTDEHAGRRRLRRPRCSNRAGETRFRRTHRTVDELERHRRPATIDRIREGRKHDRSHSEGRQRASVDTKRCIASRLGDRAEQRATWVALCSFWGRAVAHELKETTISSAHRWRRTQQADGAVTSRQPAAGWQHRDLQRAKVIGE
jgi:hypothetical protein